jgi:hypothetical protein
LRVMAGKPQALLKHGESGRAPSPLGCYILG